MEWEYDRDADLSYRHIDNDGKKWFICGEGRSWSLYHPDGYIGHHTTLREAKSVVRYYSSRCLKGLNR